MNTREGGHFAVPFAALNDELAALEAKGLRRRRRILDTAQTAHVTVDEKDYVAFCSNDYLGLANHPELIAAAQAGAAAVRRGRRCVASGTGTHAAA